MSKLKMKLGARDGVTLVELLVVILIVTILSVSLLPLLKPFVVEAQYAAEAIPVIGNLRTKIGIYQYDKGKLPTVLGEGDYAAPIIETWSFSTDGKNAGSTESDIYAPVTAPLNDGSSTFASSARTGILADAIRMKHFGPSIDVDNQDLVGKRCKPIHYQYVVITNGSSYVYALGCFGDSKGLPVGTGYAVCEINVEVDGSVIKRIGTWKRYKAATDGQIEFATITGPTGDLNAKKNSPYCPLPKLSRVLSATLDTNKKLDIIEDLESYGWEF